MDKSVLVPQRLLPNFSTILKISFNLSRSRSSSTKFSENYYNLNL